MTSKSESVTLLLHAWSAGDASARDRLMEVVYKDLRRRAAYHLSREAVGHTLQPTALVHEAYLKLTGQDGVSWTDRNHFFAVASQVMRRVLVDHARVKYAEKRGGRHRHQISLAEGSAVSAARDVDLLLLDQSLDALAAASPAQAQLVELRYFGGLTINEAADVMAISPATAKRRWGLARAWLYRRVTEGRFTLTSPSPHR